MLSQLAKCYRCGSTKRQAREGVRCYDWRGYRFIRHIWKQQTEDKG